jgi:26S proteasome regulatory subunit T2
VDELRGTPMGVGTLEEIIDDNHAIISSTSGCVCVCVSD